MMNEKKLEVLREQIDQIKINDGDRLRELVTMFEDHFQQRDFSEGDRVEYQAECAMWAIGLCLDNVLKTVDEQANLARQLLDE